MSALLAIAWLARGWLGLHPLSATLLLAGFGLSFLGRILQTRTRDGPIRAASSFLGNIAVAMIGFIFGIWILGWIATLQHDTFPAILSDQVPNFAIVLIGTGLGAFALRSSGLTRRWTRTATFVIPEGSGPTMNGTKLSLKHDTVGMPINRQGRTIGAVLLGEVTSSFVTPMGAVSAILPGPVTTVGIPFHGRRIGRDEAVRLTGKTPDQLSEESRSHAQDLDVGRIRVRDGCMGERWKIGPLIFDWDADGEHHPKERWLAKGVGTAYVTTDGHRATAKWNGSNLSVGDGVMKLAVGSDSFSYSPTEVRTTSPHHTLQVTQDKIVLDTRKFTLKVSADNVILRTESKTSSTQSRALATDLRSLLTDTAKKQVRDVMEGNPIDLGEMFNTTEEVLAKHD